VFRPASIVSLCCRHGEVEPKIGIVRVKIVLMGEDASRSFRELHKLYRERGHYPYFTVLQTRWSDNDQYGNQRDQAVLTLGHVNNTRYIDFADMATNYYLSNSSIHSV
jgi:hypothetical protein